MQTFSVDLLVGQVLGNYRVERLLGQGRLHAIYLARNLSLQRTDALTLYIVPERFSADARQRFLVRFRKEAAAVTALVHPHILPVYEYGEQSGYPYLVTPYMTNGSLADLLKQQGRFDPARTQEMLAQVITGLSYAHQRGFIHGTLKPANVILSDDGTMQVAGFGLMHILQASGIEYADQPYAHLLSITGAFLAAPEYLAPEIVQGQSIDVRSDVYALGCILFELLSGKPPFTGSNPLEVARQHVTQAIPSLRTLRPDVPIALVSVVNQALDRDPSRRFQQVSELGEAFSQVFGGAMPQKQRQAAAETNATARNTRSLQDTPAEGYASHNWQLMPPIVTSKTPTITKSAPGKKARVPAPPTLVEDDDWQQANQPVSEMMPAVKSAKPMAPAISPSMPVAPAQNGSPFVQPMPVAPASAQNGSPFVQSMPVAPAPAQNGSPLVQPMPAAPAPSPYNTVPAAQAPTPARPSDPGADKNELAKAYAWWSQPGIAAASAPVQSVQPAQYAQYAQYAQAAQYAQSAQPAQAAQPAQYAQAPTQEPMRLPGPEADWTADPYMQPMSAASYSKGPRKIKRRNAIALLATGAVAAAGAGVLFNLKHISATGQQATTTTNQQTAQTQTKPATTTQTKQTTTTQGTAGAQTPTGKIVGATSQPKNTAIAFTNPTDNQASLLISSTTGTFTAYERACTHQGVAVNYDPNTSTLICPLHGSIFDPANNGKVLQGPATKPLPSVKITVSNSGQVTAV